jgi:hypothetical protein
LCYSGCLLPNQSTANPIYETLKSLDEEDFVIDFSNDKLSEKLEEIEKGKKI